MNNIRNGFSCPNNKELTFNTVPFQPPCQAMCYNIVDAPCLYKEAFLTNSETTLQYCELLPTKVSRRGVQGRRQPERAQSREDRPLILHVVRWPPYFFACGCTLLGGGALAHLRTATARLVVRSPSR